MSPSEPTCLVTSDATSDATSGATNHNQAQPFCLAGQLTWRLVMSPGVVASVADSWQVSMSLRDITILVARLRATSDDICRHLGTKKSHS